MLKFILVRDFEGIWIVRHLKVVCDLCMCAGIFKRLTFPSFLSLYFSHVVFYLFCVDLSTSQYKWAFDSCEWEIFFINSFTWVVYWVYPKSGVFLSSFFLCRLFNLHNLFTFVCIVSAHTFPIKTEASIRLPIHLSPSSMLSCIF